MPGNRRVTAVWRNHPALADQQLMYFQLRGLPSAIHSIACASRFSRLSPRLASVSHSMHSRL